VGEFEGIREWEAAVKVMVDRVEQVGETVRRPILDEVHRSVRPTHEISKALGDSVTADLHRVGFGIYELEFGPTEAYTRVTELGHKSPRSKPAKPWFLPGWKRDLPTIESLLHGEWARAIRR
jgi:hypothetical protein